MKSCVAFLLIVLISTPASAADKSPQQQAAEIDSGNKVEVKLTTGEKLRGRLGPVSSETLTLLDEKVATAAPRTLPWTDVQQVKNKQGGLLRRILVDTTVVFGILFGIGLAMHAAGCC